MLETADFYPVCEVLGSWLSLSFEIDLTLKYLDIYCSSGLTEIGLNHVGASLGEKFGLLIFTAFTDHSFFHLSRKFGVHVAKVLEDILPVD